MISTLPKEACSRNVHDHAHTPTQQSLTDCLTKASAKAEDLITTVKTWRLLDVELHPVLEHSWNTRPYRLGAEHLVAADFGQSNFGQSNFGKHFWCHCGAGKGGVPKGGAPKGETPKSGVNPAGWSPEGWGARRVGPPRVGGPKFRAFFSLSRRKIRSFLPLWVSSRGILVVFEVPGRSNVHIWSTRAVVCEPRARSGGAARVSHDSPRAQTCTFERPGLQTPPKFHEKTPKRGRKE